MVEDDAYTGSDEAAIRDDVTTSALLYFEILRQLSLN